jgi:hypothetical protein
MCDRTREFLRELLRSNEIANLNLKLGALAKQLVRKTSPLRHTSPLMVRPLLFPNMHRLRSCEICASIAEKLWDFLCRYQYEFIVNHDEQERFAKRGGFCPFLGNMNRSRTLRHMQWLSDLARSTGDGTSRRRLNDHSTRRGRETIGGE